MEWEQFVEEGVLVAADDAKSQSLPRLNEAWDGERSAPASGAWNTASMRLTPRFARP